MRGNRIWTLGLVLGWAVLHADAAPAMGIGPGGGEILDAVFVSGDGTLEFSDFRFHGIEADDVTIEVLDDGITFSGDESLTCFGFDRFRVSYTVRALHGEAVFGTSLDLDSTVEARNGAVFAKKKIRAPRDPENELPWVSLVDWEDDPRGGTGELSGLGKHGGRGGQHIGNLVAFELASDWICGSGHHHLRLAEVEDECRIERKFDELEFDPEPELRITDTVSLLSLGKGDVAWNSVTNRFLVTPEPGSAALLALGLFGLLFCTPRRR